jgi:hypothetical protein
VPGISIPDSASEAEMAGTRPLLSGSAKVVATRPQDSRWQQSGIVCARFFTVALIEFNCRSKVAIDLWLGK